MALQHQQSYKREASLVEIDCCQKMLLTKLNEYKGEDLQVIQEASAFASESVKPNDDLLLSPYPTRSPRSLLMDSFIPPHISTNKPQNGININGGSKKNQVPNSRDPSKGRFGHFLSTTTKMVVTIVGVLCMLSLAGFEPRLGKKAATLKFTEGLRSAFQFLEKSG